MTADRTSGVGMRNVEDIYPLTPVQQGMLFHTLHTPGGGLYVERLSWALAGDVDPAALRDAWQRMLLRHPILRTAFLWEDLDEPLQVVRREAALPWREQDWREVPPDEQEARFESFLRADLERGFALEKAPLLRLDLLRLGDTSYRLVFSHHHLLLDGWSRVIVLREVSSLYTALRQGRELPLDPPRPFRDYVAWLRRQDLGEAEAFWRRELAGWTAPTSLGVDREAADPARRVGEQQTLEIRLPVGLAEALQELARRERLTLSTLFQGAWTLVLHRYSGERDIVFGVVVSGRPPDLPGIEAMIGPFINTLPARIRMDPGLPVLSWLRQIQERQVAQRRYEYSPLVAIQQWSEVPRGLPLFESLFVFENHPVSLSGSGEGEFAVGDRRYDSKAHYPLTLVVTPGGQLGLELRYERRRFDRAAVGRLAGHLETVLGGLVQGGAVSCLPFLIEAERHQALFEWNDGQPCVDREETLHGLFRAQAERSPGAVALVSGEERLTYRQLAAQAERLAHHLRTLGVGPEVVVGLFLERSAALVVAVLGILEAGGAYLPMSPGDPRERLRLFLDEAKSPLVLTEERLTSTLPDGVRAVVLDRGSLSGPPERGLSGGAGAGNLAYVIYTSGSTGRPKGVAIAHANAAALVRWAGSVFAPEDLAGVLASTSICFDLSVFELFVSLSHGGKVILADNALALPGLAAASEVTLINTVPSALAALLRIHGLPPSVRTVNLAGEPLPGALVREIHERSGSVRVLNLYGPSEDTTYSTFARIDRGEELPPIGRPIGGSAAHLLDSELRPVPLGAVGEIFLGGAGLARGYLGQPALTADRFVPDPWSAQPGARLYRTGDLGRRRPSGDLEFLGRIDHQVKLRGFRIELGEVEAALARHPAVRESIVVSRGNADEGRLVAYVVPAPGSGENLDEVLRRWLAENLPPYMVPSSFVVLESLPLSANGKIDRRALPDPDGSRARPRAGSIPPRSELERAVTEVWRELLSLEEVGIHDNFFDRGAHSLLMVRAYVKLRELCGGRLTLIDLFKYPTIASLVSFLESPGGETLQLQRGRERSESRRAAQSQGPRDVAIVGLRGRFPRARDLDQFWRNLCDGFEAISFFTDEELHGRGVPPALLQDPTYVKAGYVLEDFADFDASFFGYSPREAEVIDPQQRLFLECAWEALENAGYDPQRYPGAVGVFAGASMSGYWMNLLSHPDLLAVQGTYQAMIGNDKDFLPTRVSYKLGLRGPSLNVQSACSTSLVAVHLACQSLLNGECDMALAGGVSASARQGTGYLYSEGGIFSPDGHCRAFDAEARGTVAGSGLAVVVLKRLGDAIADGDSIRAVIKGSAINNDGSFKVGYTAPSVEGQANVIAEAQAVAGIDPDTITYVETHGTGTEVGDPIEIAALTAAWRQRTARKGSCAIGSVKTNVGHLDAAAGVTGLVKAVLALQFGKIPPSLHFQQPNPKLDLVNSPFYVNARLADWVSTGPRRAGVSSFGLGGTNAHVVLEEAPRCEPSSPSRPLQLLVLSARENLETATDNLVEFLRSHPATPLADVAYTLQLGRARFDHRRFLVCRDREDSLLALEARDPARLLTLVQKPVSCRVVFLFPGGGAQYADMGLELYRQEPVFREEVDRCLEILAPHLGLDLKPYLYPSLVKEAPGGTLSRTSTALPALFVTEVALARLWMSWGIQPQALIGHSLGEYAAACLAGVLSLEDALALVALRGRLFEKLPEGAMLSVPLPEGEVLPLLDGRLSIAAINDASQCVVSGPVEEIARLERELTAQGLEVHKLHIEVAAHSSMVEPILEEFGAFLRSLHLRAPHIPFVSNVTGTWIRDEEAMDPGYWVRQLRHTVRFAAGIEALLDVPHQVFLEMGPGRILSSFVRRHPRKFTGHEIFTTLRHVDDSMSDLELTLSLLGRLWLLGQEIDWTGFYARERRHRVPLPTYPFNRQRFWLEQRSEAATSALSRRSLAKQPEAADWFYVPSWRPAPPLSPMRSGELPPQGPWLIFADDLGFGARLSERLREEGEEVRTVPATDGLLDRGAEAYLELLGRLDREGRAPRKIVHLWSVSADSAGRLDAQRFAAAQKVGFQSLLFLVQALAKQRLGHPIHLTVVSSGAQAVEGNGPVHPENATLLGLCNIVAQEYADLSCHSVDLEPTTGPLREGALAALAERLLAEVVQQPSDLFVAHRHGVRWVRGFVPLPLEVPEGTAPGLRDRGVYLITGGLGRIGLAFAEHLARTVRARLILTGRSPFPPRERWQEWLDGHPADDLVSSRIHRLLLLEDSGAEVVAISADAADETQMRAVVALARERFGTLHGVIHGAGIVGERAHLSIAETGPAEAALHFLPKVQGALVLERVLRETELDFCLLLSSLSAILGGLGFAAYSAANAFLDALAHRLNREGRTPWMSLASDSWRWHRAEPATRIGVQTLELSLTPAEGQETLRRALAMLGVPHLVVSTGDLTTRLTQWVRTEPAASETPAAALVAPLHARPGLATPYVEPESEVERSIAGIWQQLLGVEHIGLHDSFFDLGGDSLLATRLASGLRRCFELDVPLRLLFTMPTIAAQAVAIAGLQAEGNGGGAAAPIPRRSLSILDQLADLDQLTEQEIESLPENGRI